MNDGGSTGDRLLLRSSISLLCILLAGYASAQESKVIVLHNADTLFGAVIGGQNVREWIGHVRFSQGKTVVDCDSAVQNESSGDVVVIGHVVVTDDSVTMKAPRGLYHRDARTAEAFDGVALDDGTVRLTARAGRYATETRQAFFRSNVVVRDSVSTVTADSLRYFRDGKRSVAMGRVRVLNPPDNVTIWGGHLEHETPREFSRMTVDPVLMQLDTSSAARIDTLLVRSRVMEAYRDTSKRMVAIDSVKIVRSELAGVAGFVQFFSRGDSIQMRRSPVVWYGRTQVTGDSINVYMRQRKLHRVSVLGNAFAVSQSDSLHPERFDQLTGDLMILSFENQTLHGIDVENHAISVYHVYEDSTGNGLNRTSGDRIIMSFDQGKLQTINVMGGVEGEYFPENMVKNREREYALPGFEWRADRPQIRQSRPGVLNPLAIE